MTEELVPFSDLSFQWREIANDMRPVFELVFEKSAFCLGPEVERFEREFAEKMGVGHVVAVNSGTSALHLATVAAGLGPGDEVLVPSQTFIATAWGPIYAGCTPVFCDVLPGCGTIDPADALLRLTARTKAIMPVHLYGQPCHLGAVQALAEEHGLVVIEDAAQAVFARLPDGRHVGSVGAFGCFSFYPGKNLGGAGEGGAVTTNDDKAAELLRTLRNHGQKDRYRHDRIGFNYRMDGLQGAVLRRKLGEIDRWTDRRKQIAQRYLDGLAGLTLDLPALDDREHVFHLFVLRHENREALRRHLAEKGIETGLHYPIPLHRQPCLADHVKSVTNLPWSDDWSDRGLSLPLYYGMTETQVDYVIKAVRSF